MEKRVAVVTGGAGFLGSHLCDKLIEEGFKVICLDNLITGNIKNIRHLLDNNNFRFVEQNITKYIDIGEPIDYILHFASPASPVDYMRFPIQTLKVGSLGTHNALGLALKKKATFMLASTSEVYGNPLLHPQPESYWGNVNPVGLRGCYDESKRFAEALTMAYHRVHKVDIRIVRIFNTYGPRMRIDDGRVIPNFIYQLLNNQPFTVYGKGKQSRSFCYITDLIEGIYSLMIKPVRDPINLGNPDEFTILELAKIMLKLNGAKMKIVFEPLPEDDPRQRQPNIAKAKRLLRWKPKVELREGLIKTLEWFKSNSNSH
jgi:dTDP-glucose 4,6-dehydratase